MKKVRMAANAALIIVVCAQLGVFDAMLAFVISGAIPFTQVSIPSEIMMITTITGLWLIFLRFALPILTSRNTLQVSVSEKTTEAAPAPAVVYLSGGPSFRLFSPVVHLGR